MANGMGHLSGADVSLGDPNLLFGLDFVGANLQKMLYRLGLVESEAQGCGISEAILMVTVGGRRITGSP